MQLTERRIQRREFLRLAAGGAGMVGCTIVPRYVLGGPGRTPPSEMVNVAVIGAGGHGFVNTRELLREKDAQVVAVADPVREMDYSRFYYGGVAGRKPVAAYVRQINEKRGRPQLGCLEYLDFRKLLDEHEAEIDAVLVSTPDHVHAVATAAAIRRGKHVYCEKPLAHDIYEVRRVTELARQHGVATQIGIIKHASSNYRRVVEWIRAGVIGQISEVHVWCHGGWPPHDRPEEAAPIPDAIEDWDLWIGPAPYRPYHPAYVPVTWRAWWDFGNGRLGDMGCHLIDLAFWALDLKHPETVEATGEPRHPECYPLWLTARWTFPARGGQPPVTLFWYDNDKRPPHLKEHNLPNWPQGVLFVGSEGMLVADYRRRQLYPREKFAGFQPPPASIPPSPGHKAEWLRACKGGPPALANFHYSGPLTETVLLGTAAFRAGEKLNWDPENLRATNCHKADQFLRREYRRGWTL